MPSGLTSDPDIRAAKSIVDYVFRWMGTKFLDADKQQELGIMSPEVKKRLADAASILEGNGTEDAETAVAPPPGQAALFNAWEDAVECAKWGGRMVRTGSERPDSAVFVRSFAQERNR